MSKQNSRCVDRTLSRLVFRVLLGCIMVTAFIAWTWLYTPFLISFGQQALFRTAGSYGNTPVQTSMQNVHVKTSAARKAIHRAKKRRNQLKNANDGAGSNMYIFSANVRNILDMDGNEDGELNDVFNKNVDSTTASNDINEDDYDSEDDYESEEQLTNDLVETSTPYNRIVITHPPHEKCKQRLPKALIVGVQKCGTSALMYFLSFHPQIAAVLHPPELQYFSLYYKRPLSWYQSKMKCSFSNQIPMEKSPPYFYRPKCVNRIKHMDANIKIIVIVKDPVVRALSAYAMMGATSNKNKTLPPFKEIVIKKGKVTNSKLIRWSEYSRFMDKWLAGFNLSQIYVADGHALEEDPSAELGRVEQFLGIGSYFTADKFILDKTKGKQCFHHNNSGQVDCLGSNKGRQHALISPDVLQTLQQHFKPFNENLFRMVKKRFDWGY